MASTHRYTASVTWTGNRGTGTSGYRDYARHVLVEAEGKHDISASADRTFHGDADRWNPEEFFLVALSQCHMLSYLHAAVRAGITVTSYRDAPKGTLTVDSDGAGRFTEVVLRPELTITRESDAEAARLAHDEAHRMCFIANSVTVPVAVEPEIRFDD
ncbi:OsmC family protein [Paramicrobacterium sp. CJ85]|uniref:OsmC family protein n=1 Tax=Paramicrobacterium sp. CJ85 TaxID=3445355 RepID=UPI003F5F3D10